MKRNAYDPKLMRTASAADFAIDSELAFSLGEIVSLNSDEAQALVVDPDSPVRVTVVCRAVEGAAAEVSLPAEWFHRVSPV